MDAHDVAGREQLIQSNQITFEVHRPGSAPKLHAHAERLRALAYRSADAAHANDTERLTAEPDTAQLRWRPSAPRTSAHQPLRFPDAARRCEDQRPRQVRSSVRQDTGRVAHTDSALACRGE